MSYHVRQSNSKSRRETLIGISVGFVLAIGIFFFWAYFREKPTKSKILPSHQTIVKTDTVTGKNYTVEIKSQNEIQIREQNAILDEKISSLNTRIDDLYLSLGIVITLLLAVTVSVYFKTEAEVSKHMNENYNKYKVDIQTILGEAQALLAEIKANAELAQQIASVNQGGREQELQEPGL